MSTRNLLSLFDMTAIDSQARPLPPEIIRDAICRVTDPDFPIPLTPSVRWALSILLRRVEAADGTRDFWVRRLNFAQLVDRCDKTVTNWLNELESQGLIEREQNRSHWGAFRSLTVRLTETATHLLGLDGASQQARSKALRKKTSHALLDNQQSKETTPAEASSKAGRIPEDLRVLQDLGVRETAIFKLMGLASRAGKRLGDVVAAVEPHLIKARNPFAYLRRLVLLDRDFAFIAREAAAQHAAEEARSAEGSALRAAWEAVAGKTLRWRDKVLEFGSINSPARLNDVAPGGALIFLGYLAGPGLMRAVMEAGASS